jgi:uncharacterized membrane protein YgdD (TMEM256/DUF423 family)
LVEGVSFAVGLLLVVGSVYYMAIEATGRERQSH